MVLEEHILCIWAKMCLRAKKEREARVLEKKRDCGVNLSICSRSCKKEEGRRLGLQVQRDLR